MFFQNDILYTVSHRLAIGKMITSIPFQAKIPSIHGHARFTSDPEPTVEVDGRKYTAPHILIATGGHPTDMSDDEVPGKMIAASAKKM